MSNEKIGQFVIVTGASRGLGYALSLAFARQGAQVLGVATHAPSSAEPAIQWLQADLTTEEGLSTITYAAGDRSIACLAHCAGTLGPRVAIRDYPEAAWDDVLQVNLTAVFRLTKRLLPRMQTPGGVILNLSSGAGRRAAPEWGAYAVSKFGIDGFSLLLAEELQPSGIRVYSVNPGAMRTAMRAQAYPLEDPASVPDPQTVANFLTGLVQAPTGRYPVLLNARDYVEK